MTGSRRATISPIPDGSAGCRGDEIDKRFAEALARVGLPDVGRERVGTFSRGMRQRLGLAEILMKQSEHRHSRRADRDIGPAFDARIPRHDPFAEGATAPPFCCPRIISTRCRACATGWRCSTTGRIALSGSVTDLAQRVLGGGHVIDVEVRGAGIRDRLAGMPGVVRVQVLGPELYRVDCERDLRPEIARLLAPSCELTGIRFAEPSLNEVYTRYFDELRHAA